jgi:hypothetical protein
LQPGCVFHRAIQPYIRASQPHAFRRWARRLCMLCSPALHAEVKLQQTVAWVRDLQGQRAPVLPSRALNFSSLTLVLRRQAPMFRSPAEECRDTVAGHGGPVAEHARMHTLATCTHVFSYLCVGGRLLTILRTHACTHACTHAHTHTHTQAHKRTKTQKTPAHTHSAPLPMLDGPLSTWHEEGADK